MVSCSSCCCTADRFDRDLEKPPQGLPPGRSSSALGWLPPSAHPGRCPTVAGLAGCPAGGEGRALGPDYLAVCSLIKPLLLCVGVHAAGEDVDEGRAEAGFTRLGHRVDRAIA